MSNPRNHHRQEDLDARLSRPDQVAMRSLVGSLPDDSLSMTWRSALNEKLVVEAAKRRRRQRLNWFLRPALGLGVAGAFAVLLMFRTPNHMTPTRVANGGSIGIEAALVDTHRQNSYAIEVAGVGLNPVDMSDPSVANAPLSSHWSEDDLDSSL